MIVINPKKVRPVSGTVIGKKGGLYRIQTRSGKVIMATSSASWTLGADVTVLSGEIIGVAGKKQTLKTYQV